MDSSAVKYLDRITGRPVLPIVQTEDKPRRIKPQEFKEELRQAIKPPSEGVIVFFLEDLVKNHQKLARIQEILLERNL